jgi:hypothetical protein
MIVVRVTKRRPQRRPIRMRGDPVASTRLHVALYAAGLLALGCTALGWRFGPGFSCRNAGLFASEPVVERRVDGACLTWTYGDSAFFFQPGYRSIDGRLVFALQGSSSSGEVRGRRGEVRIEGAEAIAALDAGGAVWWEPDGSYVPIRIVRFDPG